MEKDLSVKLIAQTIPLDDALATTEDLIAYCARVSNPKNQENFTTAGKLLRYLIDNKHWSPFEMVHIVMEINSSRTVARQILRHRSFSFQEFSQRYADPNHMEFLESQARLQDPKNRQNSIMSNDETLQKYWSGYQGKVLEQALKAYKWALANGVAKEVARDVLPEGLTPTRMYMAGSLRSWIHYCQLRMGHGTQKEHQDIAKECWNLLKMKFSFMEELENEKD